MYELRFTVSVHCHTVLPYRQMSSLCMTKQERTLTGNKDSPFVVVYTIYNVNDKMLFEPNKVISISKTTQSCF